MMGHISEESLALFAGGDLPPDEAANTEVHLRGCGACQALLREYRDAQEFVTASAQDPKPDELRELRAGIARKLGEGVRGVPSWTLWAAATAAAIALLFVSRFRQPSVTQVRVPEMLWIRPVLPVPHLELAAVRRTRREATRREPTLREPGIQTVALLTRPDEPSFIKITTSDPNVVILWQPTERIQ